MKYNFDLFLDRKNTDTLKWDKLKEYYGEEKLISLWVADMDFYCLPELSEALIKRAEHPTYGYTFANDNFFDNFIKWNMKRNNYRIKREEMIPIPGIVCALSFVINSLTNKGDKILLNTPVYSPFFDAVEKSGRELLKSSLVLKDNRYQMDFDDIENKLKTGVKLFILCNPHNPIGSVWKIEELKTLTELCYKYGAYIFSDEIHSDLIFEGNKHITIGNVSKEAKEISVMATAPSKTFNVAGIKSSVMVIHNEDIRKIIRNEVERFYIELDLFGFKAFEICYGKGEAWLLELVDYLQENAQFVVKFLEDNTKIKTYIPEGTYLMWLDFNSYNMAQDEIMNNLKYEAKVALNNGMDYGEEGKGFARLNIGTSREIIERGLTRIAKVFN